MSLNGGMDQALVEADDYVWMLTLTLMLKSAYVIQELDHQLACSERKRQLVDADAMVHYGHACMSQYVDLREGLSGLADCWWIGHRVYQ